MKYKKACAIVILFGVNEVMWASVMQGDPFKSLLCHQVDCTMLGQSLLLSLAFYSKKIVRSQVENLPLPVDECML